MHSRFQTAEEFHGNMKSRSKPRQCLQAAERSQVRLNTFPQAQANPQLQRAAKATALTSSTQESWSQHMQPSVSELEAGKSALPSFLPHPPAWGIRFMFVHKATKPTTKLCLTISVLKILMHAVRSFFGRKPPNPPLFIISDLQELLNMLKIFNRIWNTGESCV